MYVDDLAEACAFFINKKTKHSLINIGSGNEKTIKSFSEFIMKKLSVKLKLKFNLNKPSGTPRKILNTKLARSYGWKSKIDLSKGFDLTYKDFLNRNNQ